MNTRASVLIAAASSFAGGFLLGLLVAPESGREARQRISQAAHGSTRWVEGRLHEDVAVDRGDAQGMVLSGSIR